MGQEGSGLAVLVSGTHGHGAQTEGDWRLG